MTNIVLTRRRRLGNGSTLGLKSVFEELGASSPFIWRNDQNFNTTLLTSSDTAVIRWGCTSSIPHTLREREYTLLQPAEAIHRVNDKKDFAARMAEEEPEVSLPVSQSISQLQTMLSEDGPVVVRPRHHAQGRHIVILSGPSQTSRLDMGDFYARPLIQKTAEYRVYVVAGKVAGVAQKIPGNPEDVAWNVARGGHFVNVRWGDWPLSVCDAALRVFRHTKLDFSGIDIMVDTEGKPWFIEANSAPSLPLNSDGGPSYRHRFMAKALYHTITTGERRIDHEFNHSSNWRDYIHPAVQSSS